MALFKKPKQPTPSELETRVSAVTAAETALEAARGGAAEAERLETEKVSQAQAAVTAARLKLEEAEAAEARRPAEERKAAALARIAEIDGELQEAFGWQATAFAEREILAIEISILTRQLKQRPEALRLDAPPHDVHLGGPGEADLQIRWPGKTGYAPLR
jgi:hypothetical protein